MAPSIKVRLEVDGSPEAIAAVRAFTSQTKTAGKEATGAVTDFSKALSGVTKLFGAYQVARVVTQLAQFTKETIRATAEQKDLALSLGTTIKNFSALAAVAKATNTDQTKLVAGLGALGDRIKDLREGSPDVVKAFRQLGLGAKDFASDDIVVNTVKVAEALERVARGGSKGAIATETLGKNGRALLPVFEKLNELGGLDGAVAFAERLGVLVDSKTAATFDAIASKLQEMDLGARGLALSFAKGFGPDVVIALRDVTRLFGEMKPEVEVLGKAVGILARGMAELVVHTVAWVTVIGDSATGQFRKAATDFERFDKMIKEMRATPVEVTPVDDTVAGSSAAAAARAALETRLATAEKNRLQALDRVAEATLEQSYARGLLSLRDYYLARIDIVEGAFAREIAAIDAQIASSEVTGEREILQSQRQTLVLERAAAVQDLGNAYAAAKEKAKSFGLELQTTLTQALTSWATDGVNAVRSVEDAFRSLGLTVANVLQQVAGTWLVRGLSNAIGAALGMPPLPGMADGGLLSGPGTGTSDSMLIRASSGEYILPATVVRQPGMLAALEGLKSGGAELFRRNLGFQLHQPRGYADGGLVEPAARSSETTLGGQLTVALGDGLIAQALESPAGQRALIKVVSKNPRAFGAALGRN